MRVSQYAFFSLLFAATLCHGSPIVKGSVEQDIPPDIEPNVASPSNSASKPTYTLEEAGYKREYDDTITTTSVEDLVKTFVPSQENDNCKNVPKFERRKTKKPNTSKKINTPKKTTTSKTQATASKAPTTTSNKPTTSKTQATTSKASTNTPKAPTNTSKTRTQTTPSKSPNKSTPTSTPAKTPSGTPLPFTLPPRPTTGLDICQFPELDCLTDLDSGYDDITKRSSVRRRMLEKRAREIADIKLKSGLLEMTPKGYYSSGQLAKGEAGAKWKKEWIDYKTSNVNSVEVQSYSTMPQLIPEPEHEYITEHIVELQTISRFIQSLTETASTAYKNPIKLSQSVADPRWFNTWWNKDVQGKINTRTPFPGYENSKDARYMDKSLNDVIYEALGSTRNVKDFVLCEDGINSIKAKLWGGIQPMAEFKNKAREAAKGTVPSNSHLSALRATLAVYKYMELPGITKKMHSSIANVKAELSNIKHLTDNKLPKDAKQQDMDLAKLWIEFMNTHLENFAEFGRNWLKDAISWGIAEYQKELRTLKTWEKSLGSGPPTNTAISQRNQAITDRTAAVKTLGVAQKEVERAQDALQAVEEDIAKLDDAAKRKAEKEKVGGPYKTKKKELRKAKTKATGAQKKVGELTRKILQFDRPSLTQEIKNMDDVIKQMQQYETERTKIKPLKAE
ncbi:hypothetical protein DM02DRAFT_649788 [Periconia macrospinosa]|uniref:Uncharacterized protein n=1 Tax=Periconia macrospinosa TaxID=97972 RepID=A0A2V1E7E0_9PLEO|nr:hypothetical protein DM02DRAFT_649788 [Periconia macrospinosa]